MLFTVDTEVSYFAATLESVSPLRQAATMRLAPQLSTTSPPIPHTAAKEMMRKKGDDHGRNKVSKRVQGRWCMRERP